MLHRFRGDFVVRKLVRKQGIDKTCCFAKISKNLMFKPISSVVETMVNGTFLHSDVFISFRSSLIWTIT